MSPFEELKDELRAAPRRWLVTGAAGFIGSNLLQGLLELGQHVVGLDNFSAGHRRNLDEVQRSVSPGQWSRFHFLEGDICDLESCRRACAGIDFVLHQAALGSVPRSMADPVAAHHNNVTGFMQLLFAAREAEVRRFVYASSSAVYGDDEGVPKIEHRTGRPLSPYAATKAANELYAQAFAAAYGFASIGLRYFNVFGPRQDPAGAYAAVIPRWMFALLQRQPIHINGDGETSRDFCYVENVVQANLLAAIATESEAVNQVYNIAVGERTTLHELLRTIQKHLPPPDGPAFEPEIVYGEFRPGDVRDSQADIGKARRLLGYLPTHHLERGLAQAMAWYRQTLP
jgi:UDP-N-acetylglucosamine 4-epimerase